MKAWQTIIETDLIPSMEQFLMNHKNKLILFEQNRFKLI